MAEQPKQTRDDTPMGRTYASVIAVEVIVLLALWLLQVGFNR